MAAVILQTKGHEIKIHENFKYDGGYNFGSRKPLLAIKCHFSINKSDFPEVNIRRQ